METISNFKDAFRTHEIKALSYDDHVLIRYSGIDIVTFDDKEIILSSGGIRNKAIKSRLNQAAEYHGLNFHIFQRGENWYIETPEGGTALFSDGLKLRRVKEAEQVEQKALYRAPNKLQSVRIIENAFRMLPEIDHNGTNAKQRLYNLEMSEIRKLRAGKKRPEGFSDVQAAKFLAVKHIFDVLRGEAKYTLEDALDLPASCIFANALAMSHAQELAGLHEFCKNNDFQSITYEKLNKA